MGANSLIRPARCRVVLAQAVTKLCQQRVVCHLREVCHFHFVGQALASGSSRGDEERPAVARPGGHGSLGAHLVAGVDDPVNGDIAQQGWPVGGFHEFLNTVHVATRVDAGNPFAHRLHLGLTKRGVQSMDLPIHVRLGNMVQVDQRDSGHPTASKCFCRPRADTANADHYDMGAGYSARTSNPIQAIKPAKSPLQVRLPACEPVGGHFMRANRSLAVAAASELG